MNPRLGLLASLGIAGLMGCQGPPPRSDTPPAFVFQALKLRHQDERGRVTWELSSPEARYDVRRRLARARQPLGVIHARGLARYRLSADTGTVLNDGQLILLEGRARIERLEPSPAVIEGRRVRWIPARSEVVIDRKPQARTGRYRLLAETAILHTDEDRLELMGRPQLQRWRQGVAVGRGDPEMALNTGTLRWDLNSGALQASGPINLVRRPPGRSPSQPVQGLTATALRGNTAEQWLALQPPVQLRDPVEAINLRFGAVRLNLIDLTAASTDPFTGTVAQARVRGRGLSLTLPDAWISVAAACVLERPDVVLQADRCRWNWRDQSIEASGAVRLQDPNRRSTTNSQHLQGQLGNRATLVFSSPGGRVLSRLPLAQPR